MFGMLHIFSHTNVVRCAHQVHERGFNGGSKDLFNSRDAFVICGVCHMSTEMPRCATCNILIEQLYLAKGIVR